MNGQEAGGVRGRQDGISECRFEVDVGWLGRRLKTQGLEGPEDGSQSHEVGALVLSTLGFRGAVVGIQVWGRLSSEVKQRVGPRLAQSEAGWGATGKGDSWHPCPSLYS